MDCYNSASWICDRLAKPSMDDAGACNDLRAIQGYDPGDAKLSPSYFLHDTDRLANKDTTKRCSARSVQFESILSSDYADPRSVFGRDSVIHLMALRDNDVRGWLAIRVVAV